MKRRIDEDSSRRLGRKTRSHAETSPTLKSGIVTSLNAIRRLAPSIARGVLEIHVDRLEGGVARRVRDRQVLRQVRDEDDPDRPVEEDGRPRVGLEEADGEHDARDRERRHGEEGESRRPRDQAPLGDVGDGAHEERGERRGDGRRARACSRWPSAWGRTRRSRSGSSAERHVLPRPPEAPGLGEGAPEEREVRQSDREQEDAPGSARGRPTASGRAGPGRRPPRARPPSCSRAGP